MLAFTVFMIIVDHKIYDFVQDLTFFIASASEWIDSMTQNQLLLSKEDLIENGLHSLWVLMDPLSNLSKGPFDFW